MTGKDVAGLWEARPLIPVGTRVNVTFLAHESLQMRIAACRAVRDAGFVPVPHISARRLETTRDLEVFLAALREIGAAASVLVVAGDPSRHRGPFPDSLSVIRSGLLEKHGVEEVGFSGYPEGHPDIEDDELWRHLVEKAALTAERGLRPVVVTQFAFDAEPVAAWVGEVRRWGIDAPIRIGTPGPAGIARLLAFARRFGIGANAMIVKKYGFSLTNLVGSAGPERFVRDLAARLGAGPDAGDVGLHFYTFGGLPATAEWVVAHTAHGHR